jgi:hypothetical protein
MTNVVGPKERKLREMREEMIRRSEQNRKLLKSKLKMKAVGQVVKLKASRRGQ